MRSLADMSRLPYIEGKEIDRRAYSLLQEHFSESGQANVTVPVPLDDILEHHLELGFDYEDLSFLGQDVLGATFVDEAGKGHVYVVESLEQDPRGRLEFTQAHEAGHWVLHRHYILRALNSKDLFAKKNGGTYVVAWRDIGVPKRRRERAEIQADRFAGALLMPFPLVKQSWERLFGREPKAVGTKEQPVEKWTMMDHPPARDLARKVKDDGGFENVSVAAMVVRLGQLGYLLGQPERDLLPF